MTTIGQADFDILAGIGPILNTLARLGARYALTGSLAAVAHGVGRAVGDVDLVAELTPQQTTQLAIQLLHATPSIRTWSRLHSASAPPFH